MRRFPLVCLLLTLTFCISCTTERKVSREPVAEQPLPVVQDYPKPPVGDLPVPSRAEKPKSETLTCTEDTTTTVNMSGIESLPFLRVAFHDIDGDDLVDMIAGSKHGLLSLYRYSGDRRWTLRQGYFDGIAAGAFSAPAVADVDGDGTVELVVGTGGFSSFSGRILAYKNYGTRHSPVWREVPGIDLRVGNDAAVTLVDYTADGKPDIIAGNSEGKIFFFRNTSRDRLISFAKDPSPFKRSFGMYAVPAAVSVNGATVLAVGNAMGELFLFELRRNGKGIDAQERKIMIAAGRFAAPSFIDMVKPGRYDLVLASGDGILSYFENSNGNFSSWVPDHAAFNAKVFAGPACSPTLASLGNRDYLVIGNMDGTLTLFESTGSSDGLPWRERKDFLRGIKVSAFSRGVIAEWQGSEIVIVGESDGRIRAFVNAGSPDGPRWIEEKDFFRGVRVKEHATPAVFDIDGDGTWELVTGSADGNVHLYRIRDVRHGLPVWEKIEGTVDHVSVDSFSTPTFAKDGLTLYLLVGQQDGKIRTFTATLPGGDGRRPLEYRTVVFREKTFLQEIRMNGHSSPFARMNEGTLELISGDYDGNIRHFTCRQPDRPALSD